jgi:spore maturation protein CgeD
MKISCILTSYNRPRWVEHALKSVQDQSHKNFELLVYDDSTIFDIQSVVRKFSFPQVKVVHTNVSPQQRKSQNRLGVNCNSGVKAASGELICYLCDDDYYFPGWFKACSEFFSNPANKTKDAAFGILMYSKDPAMTFPTTGERRFFDAPVRKPGGTLDHNQVVHRKFKYRFYWPIGIETVTTTDGTYFNEIAKSGRLFYPIHEYAAVKRRHPKNLQITVHHLGKAEGEGCRE